MNVVPSELIGELAVDSAASQTPMAEISSAIPMARPMATRPTTAETMKPGCQGAPTGFPAGTLLGVGREVVVMRVLRDERPGRWACRPQCDAPSCVRSVGPGAVR